SPRTGGRPQGSTALGWFEVVRQSEGSYVKKVLGEHADWATHEQTELPYLEAEEDRLLYVAATRAREMLVVSRWTGNQKHKAWGVLNDFLTTAKELPIPQPCVAAHVAALDSSVEAQAAAATSRMSARDI